MELYLVIPAEDGEARRRGDEELNGKWWRVKGPIDPSEIDKTKFHCVSYVWGEGIDVAGSFFDCKRDFSNKTKPALVAAMRAAEAMHDKGGEEKVEAFWIDALCVPQLAGVSRRGTLESMGFIYSKAASVIVILQGAGWEIVKKASASKTAMQLSPKEMEDLEHDTWISRVWTYQEMVNNNNVYFTTFSSVDEQVVVPYEPLLDCIGYSSERWTKETGTPQAEFLQKFPNLNNLADTLFDARISWYLNRSALAVLSNMSARAFDPRYPGNRLLASLGALTQKASWSPAASLSELSEKVMSTCEEVNDYSFIYTSDQRDDTPGLRWRPSPHQFGPSGHKPIHLIPVLNWCSNGEPFGETQRAHTDSQGIWLDNMVRLQISSSMSGKVEQGLENWLYGSGTNPSRPEEISSVGFWGLKEKGKSDLISALFRAFGVIGFTGSSKALVCENGLFFSVLILEERQDVEIFAASSIRWKFGAPGLARWKEGDVIKYSAGVFAGVIDKMVGESVLMI